MHGLDFHDRFCLCPLDFMNFGNQISEFVLFWMILKAIEDNTVDEAKPTFITQPSLDLFDGLKKFEKFLFQTLKLQLLHDIFYRLS